MKSQSVLQPGLDGSLTARLRHAWIALVAALALHVADEAATGFLDVYNPLVRSVRERLRWFPAPEFTFGPWLTGLLIAIATLALLTMFVRRGGALVRVLCVAFGGLMLMNGLGHLLGSVYFGRWLPGATSSPVLIAASAWLLVETARRASARDAPPVTLGGC